MKPFDPFYTVIVNKRDFFFTRSFLNLSVMLLITLTYYSYISWSNIASVFFFAPQLLCFWSFRDLDRLSQFLKYGEYNQYFFQCLTLKRIKFKDLKSWNELIKSSSGLICVVFKDFSSSLCSSGSPSSFQPFLLLLLFLFSPPSPLKSVFEGNLGSGYLKERRAAGLVFCENTASLYRSLFVSALALFCILD